MRRLWLVGLISLFVLVACNGESDGVNEGQVVAEATAVSPTSTPLPTTVPSATPEPTETAVPPTPEPTETAVPEPAKLSYMAYFGGDPAGQWDRENYGRYLESNPLVTIQYTSGNLYRLPVPDGIHAFITGPLQPDMMSSYIVGNLRTYAEQGVLHDLTDLWEEEGWDELFAPSLKELVTVNGRQYFVPQALQWNPIWYRTDIFAEVGLVPPQSWEEMLTACDTLHEAGYIPIAVSGRSWIPPLARWFTILNMRLNGPDFHESLMRGEVSYEDPRVRNVFVHWQMMFEHHCFAEDVADYREAAQQIYQGEAAMYNLGEWLAESYDEGIPETFDFFTFPVLDPALPRGEIVHVYGAYILADSDQLEAAEDFLRYLASAESQTTTTETLGRLVSNQTVDDSLYSDVYLRGREFVAEAEHITQLLEFNTHPKIANAALIQFNLFYRSPDEQTIDEILATLEEARLQAIEAGG